MPPYYKAQFPLTEFENAFLEKFAKKRGLFTKEGEPNVNKAAQLIVQVEINKQSD